MSGHHQHVDHVTGGLNGLSAAAVAIPTGATAGYGYPDVTQYGARTHPAMAAAAAAAAGHFTATGTYHSVGGGGGGGGGSLRDQCQVNGMLGLAGLGAATGVPAGVQSQHHPHQASAVGAVSGVGGVSGGNQHPVQQQQQQQQSNVPTYKWMQVKRNVPKPGKSPSRLISLQYLSL